MNTVIRFIEYLLWNFAIDLAINILKFPLLTINDDQTSFTMRMEETLAALEEWAGV